MPPSVVKLGLHSRGICRSIGEHFTMKTILALALLSGSILLSHAEMQAPVALWPDGAPGALGASPYDIPTLTAYLPEATNLTGAAMVICPGGAYMNLSPYEGNDYALWLNQHGVTCFVLKYRLGSHGYRHPAELNDAARAVRWVRAHAQEFKVDTHRVGIMGSSAGGHLAATLLTHFDAGDPNAADVVDRESSRPDLGVLCYPVISMGEFTHQGSKDSLLGTNPPPELVSLLSNELQVTPNTPPCFLWTTFEDQIVPMENTMLFAAALRKNHVPFDLHVYEQGGHGMGLHDKPPFAHPHPWTADCLFWLKVRKFVN
jgi:acetyl esterase/lipase